MQRSEDAIEQEEIARLAGCSFGFFQKVFSYLNGISFAEYVRSRKLTLAGYALKSTDKKVIEIGYTYGYDSPTSFTKAFQKFHGVSPSVARKPNTKLRIVGKLQVSQRRNGSWKMTRLPSFRLIGKRAMFDGSFEDHIIDIPAFWNTCQKNGVYTTLTQLDEGEPKGMFGVFSQEQTAKQQSYSLMVSSKQALPDGFEEIIIPSMTWAIFQNQGRMPEAMQNGWRYLREEWLVAYPFIHANCPELEWYSDTNPYSDAFESQIWIPIEES